MIWGRKQVNTGQVAEEMAVRYLLSQGLELVARNFQPPGRGMADLDIVMRDRDGTLVFIEIRLRSSTRFGGLLAVLSQASKNV